MSRLPAVDPVTTTGKTAETLAAVGKMLGATPNLFRVAATSAPALEALVGMNVTLARGSLPARVREQLALVVAQTNGCDYCLSAHTALGQRAGLAAHDIDRARDGVAADAKTSALLGFARRLVIDRAQTGEAALAAVRQAGASDAEILEVIAHVVLNIFTNYINLVADTDIDFPVVRAR